MNAYEILKDRNIPELFGNENHTPSNPEEFEIWRNQVKEMLQQKEYGRIPPKPDHLSVELTDRKENFCAGRARLDTLMAKCQFEGNEICFPFYAAIPKAASAQNKRPAFVLINFTNAVPDRYYPAEEIIDRGYAVFSFGYKDVTLDENEFRSGVAQFLSPSRKNGDAPGKIAIWAWAAMRVMDYACALDCIDLDNVAVVGHSRLGKTALVAGGFDERFKYVISNDSGCSGAAITRGKVGESMERICEVFPHWFCPSYVNTAQNGGIEALDFDQHFLLALSVPRHLLIGSSKEDAWADPASEFLSLLAVEPAYGIFGMKGLVHENKIPEAKTYLGDGEAMYHIRTGTHYFSREDWQAYMDYIESCMKKDK